LGVKRYQLSIFSVNREVSWIILSIPFEFYPNLLFVYQTYFTGIVITLKEYKLFDSGLGVLDTLLPSF